MENKEKVKQLIELRAQAKLGVGQKRIDSQHSKGKYCKNAKINKNFFYFADERSSI